MPIKKKTEETSVVNKKEVPSALKVSPPKVVLILASLFFIIWIVVGLFALLVIFAEIKAGALASLLGRNNQAPSTQSQAPVETPTEGNLPGVGSVNISCVREALSSETIGKVLEKQNTNDLTAEEKDKLEKCKVEETSSPAPST